MWHCTYVCLSLNSFLFFFLFWLWIYFGLMILGQLFIYCIVCQHSPHTFLNIVMWHHSLHLVQSENSLHSFVKCKPWMVAMLTGRPLVFTLHQDGCSAQDLELSGTVWSSQVISSFQRHWPGMSCTSKHWSKTDQWKICVTCQWPELCFNTVYLWSVTNLSLKTLSYFEKFGLSHLSVGIERNSVVGMFACLHLLN